MKTTLWSIADSVMQTVVEELEVEANRITSKEVQKLNDVDIFVAKQRSQIFSALRDVKPKKGALLSTGVKGI